MDSSDPRLKNLRPFKPGNNANPKGRPKKTYKQHIADIRAKGYKPPTPEEYRDMVLLLLSMTEEDLKIFATEKERPYWIRVIITDLNNKNSRQKLMSDHRDWLFGKAKQEYNHLSGGEKISNITVQIVNATQEEDN